MSKQTALTRRSFVALSAVATVGALAGCSSSGEDEGSSADSDTTTASDDAAETPTIRLGMTASGHVFNAIAEAQGYLEEEGVIVEENAFSTNDDAFSALFAGKVDVLSTQGTNLPLTHISSGQDLVIYAGYMLTGCMPVIAQAGTEWNGVEDLVGKTIACSGSEFAVFGPFCDMGYTMDDLTVIELSDHSDRTEAVRSGKADYAILGTNQNYNISQMDDVEVMAYCSDITPNYSCCRVQSMRDFFDENQEALQAMLRAWMRAQSWYEDHKDEAAELVAEQLDTTVDYVNAYMQNEHYRLNIDPYRTSVERAWDWMGEMGLLEDGYEDIDLSEHLDTTLYKAALDANTEAYGEDDADFYDSQNEIYEEYDA